MKRTIVKILLMLSILFVSVGSTVAYLTDVDKEVNVMTLDRVEIDLIEEERNAAGTLVEFQDHHPLYPGYYPKGLDAFDQDGYWLGVQNAVDKVVTVKNTGRAPAYVRLWFAFEVTDDHDFFRDKIHLNTNSEDWQWTVLADDEDGDYIFLEQNDTRYVVYIATYNKVLASGATTPVSLRQVLLDSSATNDDLVKLGDKYSIFVVAQGMQSAGFDSATQALNEGFGVPTVGNHPFVGMNEETADKPDNVLVISTAEELIAFARAVSGGDFSFTNQTVVLSNDIDMTGYIWPSISCAYSTHQFTGIFDGQGHTISNLNNSLFSDVDAVNGGSLVIRNINIDGGYVEEYGSMGAILDRASGSIIVSIENCHVSNMTIVGESQEDDYYTYAGAIAGRMSYGSIKNCSAQNCTIYTIYGAGKLVGEAWGTAITDCTAENVTIYLDKNGVVSAYNPGVTSCDAQNGIIHNQLLYDRKDSYEEGWYSHNVTCYTCGKVLSHSCTFTCLSDACAYCGRTKAAICYHVGHQWESKSTDALSHLISCAECGEVLKKEDHHSYCLEAEDGICAGCGASGVTIGNQWHYEGYKNITDSTHDRGCLVCDYVERTEEHRYYGKDTQCRLCGAEKVIQYVKLIQDGVYLRKTPTSGSIITKLDIHTVWPILSTQESGGYTWYHIDVNGTFGYVRGDMVTEVAASPASDFKWKKTADGKGVNITGYTGTDTDVVIPATIDGLPVTGIGDYAFDRCTSLTSITIPDSVTSIGISAFNMCTSLKSITIPNSVTTVAKGAFWGCTSLPSIIIPANVTSIGHSAFSGCTNLTSITIPDGVSSIDYGMFYGCTSLKSIIISEGVTSIGDDAFRDCTSLESVIISDSNEITSIGANAFWGCTNLSNIEDADTLLCLTSVGDYAFKNCSDLQYFYFSEKVSTIGTGAFDGCTSISVQIENNYDAVDYCVQNGIPIDG